MTRMYEFGKMTDDRLFQDWTPNLPWSPASGDPAVWSDDTPVWARLPIYYPNPLYPDGLPKTVGIVDGALQLTIEPSPDPSATAGKEWLSGMITLNTVIAPGTFTDVTFTMTDAPGINFDAYLLSTVNGAEEDLGETIGHDYTQSDHGATVQTTHSLVNSTLAAHTVGFDFERDILTWYLDGRMTMQVVPSAAALAAPMQLVLQATRGGPGYWAGSADANTPDVAVVRINDVAVFNTYPH